MVNDIQQPNALDGAWAKGLGLRGLKSIGQLFSKDKAAVLESLKENIKQMFKPRLSYKPGTLFNKLSNLILPKSVKSGLKFLGIGNPGVEKSAFVAKFQKVDKQTDLNSLDIPGYDSFKALSKDTQIAMLGGQVEPNSDTEKLGIHILRPNSGKRFQKTIELAKEKCKADCDKVHDLAAGARQSIADFEQKKKNEISKLKDSPEDWFKRDQINEKYDKLIRDTKKSLNKYQQLIDRSDKKKDVELRSLEQKYETNKKDHETVDKLFNALPPNIKDSIRTHGAVIDKFSGMAASLFYDPSKNAIHVVFGGTGAGNDQVGGTGGKIMGYEQVSNDITTSGLLSNHVPPSYVQARNLVGAIKAVKEKQGLDINIEVKGFSMGGGMAAYAGIYHDVKALSHCGAPVSPACQRSLGSEKMEQAVSNNKIFNTSVQGDWVTDQPVVQTMARAFETVTSLQVARHIGNGLRLSGEDMTVGNKAWKDIDSGLKHPKSARLFKAYEPIMENKKMTQPVDNMTEINYI